MENPKPSFTQIIDDTARKLSDLIPEGVHAAKQDMDKNIHAVLQSMLHKLDLVTREEFDAQIAVLAKTRQKLAFLEAELAEISNALEKKHPEDTE